ncbi:MAG: protein kinase domain-containing protein, partial [Planctomycetota bacterium]
TPYYMAPEMLQRRGDARSDIYSLGILLYECLYGDVPFRGDSEWEVLKKHEVATPEFPPHASAADRAIVLRCLQKRPEDRFASVAELLRALQAPVALGDSLVLAPAPSCALPAPSMSSAPAVAPVHAVEPPPLRDPAESPYGMPWRPAPTPRGPIGALVHGFFSLVSLVLFVVLLPVRAISTVAGRGIVWLVKLPFTILGLMLRLIGLLLVMALVVLALVTVASLLAAV